MRSLGQDDFLGPSSQGPDTASEPILHISDTYIVCIHVLAHVSVGPWTGVASRICGSLSEEQLRPLR